MKLKRTKIPGYLRWPVNSTRMLLPTIALRGFRKGPMSVVFAFWKWRVDFEILP